MFTTFINDLPVFVNVFNTDMKILSCMDVELISNEFDNKSERI